MPPASTAIRTLNATFLPILSPDGTRAIYWRGRMTQQGFGWIFSTGGMPYLGTGSASDPFATEKQLFPTLVADQNAFASAEIAWSDDANWVAVWNAEWTGDPQQVSGEPFPDRSQVYVVNVAKGELIQAAGLTLHAAGESVIDVAIGPYGFADPAVAVTVGEPGGGESQGAPGEQSRLILTTTSASDGGVVVAEGSGWEGPIVHQSVCCGAAP